MAHRQSIGESLQVKDGPIFVGLLLLLVWAPLPVGSNRFWAGGILLVLSVALLLCASWIWRTNGAQAWRRLILFRLPLGLLSCMVMLTWLQTLPLPAAWVSAISPMAATVQAPAAMMTLSLDVYQSRYMASLSFVYLAVFLLAVLTHAAGKGKV